MWVCCMWFDMFCVCGEKSRRFGAGPLKQSEKALRTERAKIRRGQALPAPANQAGSWGGNGNMPVK